MANNRAMCAVKNAVKRGDLPHISTQICTDCGGQAQHYDHRDYDKPLEVEPTCRSCNMKRGGALGKHDVHYQVSARITAAQHKKLLNHLNKTGMSISQWIANRIDLMRVK